MQNCLVFILFALISIEIAYVKSYKILGITPIAAPSHYIVNRALMRGLAADGHEVTLISPFKDENPPPNYNEIHLNGIYELFVNSMFIFYCDFSKIFEFISFHMQTRNMTIIS